MKKAGSLCPLWQKGGQSPEFCSQDSTSHSISLQRSTGRAAQALFTGWSCKPRFLRRCEKPCFPSGGRQCWRSVAPSWFSELLGEDLALRTQAGEYAEGTASHSDTQGGRWSQAWTQRARDPDLGGLRVLTQETGTMSCLSAGSGTQASDSLVLIKGGPVQR